MPCEALLVEHGLRERRQIYGMNFLALHGKFFFFNQFWWSLVTVCSKFTMPAEQEVDDIPFVES